MDTILAIDDNRDNLQSLEAVFSEYMEDCRFLSAQSGMKGLEMAKRELPDTILLDIRMPGMDGFEVCRILKKSTRARHIPVIMLTAMKAESGDIIKGLESGADAFMSKPIDPAELAAQVRVALRVKHSEDELRNRQQDLEEIIYERTKDLVTINRRLKEENIERKKIETDLRQSQKDLRQLSLHLEEVKDMEQSRIAGELHDELGQLLTALKMELVQIQKRITASPDAVPARIEAAIGLNDDCIRSVREISSRLRSEIIGNLGLKPALSKMIQTFITHTDMMCQLNVDDVVHQIAKPKATAIFRIIQESLTNVARHAQASEISVKIWEYDGNLSIEVKDNGIGLNSVDNKPRTGFGIIGMRERARALEGRLEISENREGGTLLKVTLPIENLTS